MNKKLLFLGYDKFQTNIIKKIENHGYDVIQTSSKIHDIHGYSSIISYGYRHIISKEIIESINFYIINLHASYLPWNRGSHPNFWSFYDNTPKGFTIHIIDKGIDTGPILFQKEVNFLKDEDTFSKTYWRLRVELEKLFIENMDAILNKNYISYPQSLNGTYHKNSDLKGFNNWDINVNEFDSKILK